MDDAVAGLATGFDAGPIPSSSHPNLPQQSPSPHRRQQCILRTRMGVTLADKWTGECGRRVDNRAILRRVAERHREQES